MEHTETLRYFPLLQIVYTTKYDLPMLSSEVEDWRDWLYLLTLSAAVKRRD
jgi:hypothetical protein